MNGRLLNPSIPRISPQKWVLFFIGVAAMFLRYPPLFFTPRFRAEEGSVFFAFAFSHPWLEALIRPDGGNYDFARNLASVVAVHFAPLEWAPLATTLFSAAIQLTGLSVILTHSSRELGSPLRQAIAIALYLFAPTSDEIWLTTLHSQRYLSIIAFLILLDQPNSSRVLKIWFHRLLLLLAAVSGPETSLLAPIFLLKARREGGRENMIQAAIVSAGAAFQVSIFMLFPSETSRFYPLNLATFATIVWTKNIVLPFFGMLGIKPLRWAYRYFSTGFWDQHIFGATLLLVEAGIFYLLVRKLSLRDRLLIFGSFVLTTVASIAFMIGEKAELISEYGGNRYFFAPNFMLGLLLMLNVDWEGIVRSRRSKVCAALLTWELLMGGYRFGLFYTSSKSYVSWSEEVFLWRQDPSRVLRIYPEGWTVQLDPRRQ